MMYYGDLEFEDFPSAIVNTLCVCITGFSGIGIFRDMDFLGPGFLFNSTGCSIEQKQDAGLLILFSEIMDKTGGLFWLKKRASSLEQKRPLTEHHKKSRTTLLCRW